MAAAHRHGDFRACGATTVVSGQSTIFVNGELWAVDGDKNTHGEGGLQPSGSTVFIEGQLVIVNTPDLGSGDLSGHNAVETRTSEGSPDVSAY